MNPKSGPPPLHEQPPPGLPNQMIAHAGNHQAPYLPNDDERTTAMLIHLLMIVTGFIGPLILWLVRKDSSAFINHHGKEALNNAITTIIVGIAMLAIVFATLGLGVLIYLPWTLMVLIFEIIACVEAHKGNWHRIPLIIRLIQ